MSIQPCPFCGNTDPAIDEIEMGIWAICCDECKTIGPHQDGEQTPEEAIAKWNRRGRNIDFISQALNEGDGVYRP